MMLFRFFDLVCVIFHHGIGKELLAGFFYNFCSLSFIGCVNQKFDVFADSRGSDIFVPEVM